MRVLIILAVSLTGCVGPLVPVTKVEETTARELQKTVAIYDEGMTPAKAKLLGPIMATSCKNKIWDAPASNEDATNQLRVITTQRGGNAVGNLSCVKYEYSSMSTNCWETVTCTGISILTN